MGEKEQLKREKTELTNKINNFEHSTHMVVTLRRTGNSAWGFNLKTNPISGKHEVKVLATGSVAHQAGLRTKDCLVEVNGTNVQNMNHREIVNFIKSLAQTISLRVLRSV